MRKILTAWAQCSQWWVQSCKHVFQSVLHAFILEMWWNTDWEKPDKVWKFSFPALRQLYVGKGQAIRPKAWFSWNFHTIKNNMRQHLGLKQKTQNSKTKFLSKWKRLGFKWEQQRCDGGALLTPTVALAAHGNMVNSPAEQIMWPCDAAGLLDAVCPDYMAETLKLISLMNSGQGPQNLVQTLSRVVNSHM